MQSRYWSFVEACDEANTVRAARDLLAETIRSIGLDAFAIVTHAPAHDVGSLGVFVHNWPQAAVDHLIARQRDGRCNPLFEAVETSQKPVLWNSGEWRRTLKRDQVQWMDRLGELVKGDGATLAVRTALVTASCSLTGSRPFPADRLKLALRIATYAFHHIQHLQRPPLNEPDRLTLREHECLYRATIHGERPSVVARRLGVKVSTVRTLRQKANGRLDAASSEQAVWRLLETGQLFRCGRKSKPRSW